MNDNRKPIPRNRDRIRIRRPGRTAQHCPRTGKRRYRDHRQATDALRHARYARDRAALDGLTSDHREERSYKCPSCAGWHLTSRGPRPTDVGRAA